MIEYIDAYRDRFGVEAICRTLKETERGADVLLDSFDLTLH